VGRCGLPGAGVPDGHGRFAQGDQEEKQEEETVTERTMTAVTEARSVPRRASMAVTRMLLYCGVVAGPVSIIVALLQMLTRDGFDLRRHPLSALSLGDWGWIQVSNFVVGGVLSVALAIGMRRVWHPRRGGTWGPFLIGAYGVGMVGAGVFTPDPANGFPPEMPSANANALSWHGWCHFVIAGLAFLALIIACFVAARRFAAGRKRGWAAYSAATGIVFFAAWLSLMASSGRHGTTATRCAAGVLGWVWLSTTAGQLLADQPNWAG
jgi:hypothetical protein